MNLAETLADAIDLFIFRPEIAPATQRTYMYDLRALRDYLGPARRMDDIIPADLLRYVRHLNQSPTIKSAFTYNKHITSIRALFKFCLETQIALTNPAVVLKKKKVDSSVPESKAMPDRKLAKLLEYVKETARGWNPREEALVRFLADTGVRIGSAATLTDDPQRLNLRERWAKVEMKNIEGLHTVRFGRECSHAISSWLLMRDATAGNYVFSTDGHRMKNDSLGQYFERLCQRAGIGTWGPHSLRHRLGHRSMKKYGAAIGAKMLGDSLEVFLLHYSEHDDAAVQQAMLDMTTDHLLDVGIITPKFKES